MQTQHEDLWQITNQSYSVGWKLDISNSSPWGHHWRRPVYGGRQYLKMGGPSVLLAYIIAGLFVFFIMRSMGEMLFLEPVTGSFAVYAHRYMSPFFGYLTAWSYWFMWMAVGISEITAIGVYVQFWFPEMAQWIPALIAVALVALANLAAVRLYGEIEFWFAMIKVTTIIVMIVIGLA